MLDQRACGARPKQHQRQLAALTIAFGLVLVACGGDDRGVLSLAPTSAPASPVPERTAPSTSAPGTSVVETPVPEAEAPEPATPQPSVLPNSRSELPPSTTRPTDPPAPTTVPALPLGPLNGPAKQELVRQTGIPELSGMALERMGARKSTNGGLIEVFTVNGAAPFVTADAVADAVESFERIARRNRTISVRLALTSSTIDANFVFAPVTAKHHLMFMGGPDFLPSNGLPHTFANTADGAALGVTLIDEYGAHRDTSSSFMGDATKTPALRGDVNYALAVLNVEACQNTVHVELAPDTMARVGANRPLTSDPGSTARDIGQELICNSFGAARAFKSAGASYDQYAADMQHAKFNLYPPIPLEYVVVDETTYAEL